MSCKLNVNRIGNSVPCRHSDNKTNLFHFQRVGECSCHLFLGVSTNQEYIVGCFQWVNVEPDPFVIAGLGSNTDVQPQNTKLNYKGVKFELFYYSVCLIIVSLTYTLQYVQYSRSQFSVDIYIILVKRVFPKTHALSIFMSNIFICTPTQH